MVLANVVNAFWYIQYRGGSYIVLDSTCFMQDAADLIPERHYPCKGDFVSCPDDIFGLFEFFIPVTPPL
jgi:hypothetical protein